MQISTIVWSISKSRLIDWCPSYLNRKGNNVKCRSRCPYVLYFLYFSGIYSRVIFRDDFSGSQELPSNSKSPVIDWFPSYSNRKGNNVKFRSRRPYILLFCTLAGIYSEMIFREDSGGFQKLPSNSSRLIDWFPSYLNRKRNNVKFRSRRH